MFNKSEVVWLYGQNVQVVARQTAGLTDEQALLQPPFRGNCLNWTVGHLISSRDRVLEALGAETLFTSEQTKRYGHSSEPVCGPGEGVIPLHELLALLQESQTRLQVAIENASDELLDEERHLGPNAMRCGFMVGFMLWHDSYHVGQTELLRQLAGADDSIL